MSASQSEDTSRINRNVTSRRKQRRRNQGSDDDEDENFLPTSSAKKKQRSNRAGPSSISLARRNLNFDGLPPENKKDEEAVKQPALTDDEVILKLLKCHLQYSKLVNPNNCFEKETVLDVINKDVVRRESMADMAIILSSAVDVYGYRVDRCFLNAQDARSNITQSLARGKSGEQLTSPVADTPTKKKRGDVKKNLGDWKARIDEDQERELATEEEEEGNEGEETEKENRLIAEDDYDIFLDSIPTEMEDMDNFLNELQKQRKEQNVKITVHNTHLVEDVDELIDKSNKELSQNEYYQKATSRYGDGNANALLMYNSKVTSDAQAYIVHPRVVTKRVKYSDDIDLSFLSNVRATLANALSQNPKKLPNDLLPEQSEIVHESDLESDVEDEAGTMLMNDAIEANRADQGQPPAQQEAAQPQAAQVGQQVQAAQPLANNAANPPGNNQQSEQKKVRKSIMFRGPKLTIDRLWIPTNLKLDFEADQNNLIDREEFRRFQAMRNQQLTSPQEEQEKAPELSLNFVELKERAKYLELAGIDDEMKELDNLWNARIVKRTVTSQETEDLIREVEENATSSEEVLAKKRRILQPGDYIFFIEGDPKENTLIPVDEFEKEARDAGISVAGAELFDDNYDDDGPFDFPMAEDFTEREDRLVEQIRVAMENPREAPKQEVMAADVPDVPVNPALLQEVPSERPRNVGKEDDAHWKGRQTNEPEKETKRATRKVNKQEKEEKPPMTEAYWGPSTVTDRRKAYRRFITKPNSNYEKHQSNIYHAKAIARPAYQQFNFETFNQISSYSRCAYSGYAWEGSAELQEEPTKKALDSQIYDEEGRDIMGIEWAKALRGIQLVIPEKTMGGEYKPDRNTSDLSDEGIAASQEDSVVPNGDPEIIEVVEDHLTDHDYGASGFEDLPGTSISPERDNTKIVTQPRHFKNKLQEIRELQAADDYEEEGEIAEGIGGHHVQIKNSTIDQSKVKSYLKGILTNKMMDSKSLKTVTEAAADQEFIRDATMAVLDATSAGQDISLLGRSFDFKNTGIDPLEISRIVFTSPETLPTQSRLKPAQTEPSTSKEALKNTVVLSDFDVDGEHSLSSMLACLPFRAQRFNEKNMHVAMLFSVALQMCNENTLHCVQNKKEGDTSWMRDFIMKNGSADETTPDATSSRPVTSKPRTARARIQPILEEDEELNNSQI